MRFFLLFAAFALSLPITHAVAHCQIPCGIYGDERIFDELGEHVRTIEKSMTEIQKIEPNTPEAILDIARWTKNKEKHAQDIQDIMAEYFLAQRIKAPAQDADQSAINTYHLHLKSIHAIITAAMRCKQNTNTSYSTELMSALKNFEDLYMHKD